METALLSISCCIASLLLVGFILKCYEWIKYGMNNKQKNRKRNA